MLAFQHSAVVFNWLARLVRGGEAFGLMGCWLLQVGHGQPLQESKVVSESDEVATLNVG